MSAKYCTLSSPMWISVRVRHRLGYSYKGCERIGLGAGARATRGYSRRRPANGQQLAVPILGIGAFGQEEKGVEIALCVRFSVGCVRRGRENISSSSILESRSAVV